MSSSLLSIPRNTTPRGAHSDSSNTARKKGRLSQERLTETSTMTAVCRLAVFLAAVALPCGLAESEQAAPSCFKLGGSCVATTDRCSLQLKHTHDCPDGWCCLESK
ncbi:hypothetical protein E2C01_004754 [Portunus trituberculatus]|uniref:Uncharacterized protein n=1 Tax=Portunus trituberculatus TaxID=210409 RepID=A0A5B7CUS3_PORTR|nr:hypothetical protein [Portunus trituberculatus]